MPVSTIRRPVSLLFTLITMLGLLSGCASPAAGVSLSKNAAPPAAAATTAAAAAVTTPAAQAATPTVGTPGAPRLWISPALPKGFREQMKIPNGLPTTTDRTAANLWLEPAANNQSEAGNQPGTNVTSSAWSGGETSAAWIYAAVAPFPTLTDDIKLADLQSAWKGKPPRPFEGRVLLVSAETGAVFEKLWGPADTHAVKVVQVGADALLNQAWKEQPSWAIIPFEDISPRWKVLRVEGQSPLDKRFDPAAYPLTVNIRLGHAEGIQPPAGFSLPSNRDPSKLTVVLLTGVTALSRHIGERMESKGMSYPARDILPWFQSADLVHISNEVSFYKDCPKPGPERADMRFCSSPKYIELLEAVGTDIVELTGNHILDWGTQPFLDTLEMYRQRGWKTYGGGDNLKDAQKPLLIEQNGSKLAFLGCSPAGPEPVWATTDRSGSTPCNYTKLETQIQQLRADGYLPIVTLQAVETDTYKPAVAQGMPDFRRLARAGAVIVSGSQSHVPQTMTFTGDSFVHYGLGNLFFDQMNPPETRQEFLDRHVFYNGKYLGVELLTALLEDYSRPRPMQPAEREDLLKKIFSLSDWSGN